MHVLLVEDSVRLRESLVVGLGKCGYALDAVADGESGLRYARHNQYDVIVLDLMLPKLDGWEVLKSLRNEGNQTHILILTARGNVEDRVRGLRGGADDYLSKPFSFDELVARIEALIRRDYRTKNTLIEIGPLAVDTTARTVTRDGNPVHLSRREYALLEYLAYRKGQVVDRREVEDHLYSERNFPMSNAVDRLICGIRKKIGSHAEADGEELLSTRRGRGFVLQEPPV